MMYGSQSPKRHWAYSDSRSIGKLDIGSKKGFKSKITTVEKYTNRAGKVCYKGTDKLRGTEKFGQISPYFLKINVNCVKMLLIEKCVINYRDCCLPTWLRNYPKAFGAAVLRLRDELLANQTNSHKNLFRSPCFVDTPPSGPETVTMSDEAADEQGLFAFVGLHTVYEYARGCKYLCLPMHWKELLPHTIPEDISFSKRMEMVEMET